MHGCRVNTLNAECPEFRVYKACVDDNDFDNSKCRRKEKPVLDFWNAKMGYVEPAAVPAAAASSQHH
jgi:hypothetical protein